MKNIESAKLFRLPFLFLAISLLILSSPSSGNAQTSSSSINLEGTQWVAKPDNIVNVDASVTVVTYTYFFSKQGKVKLIAFATKGTGIGPDNQLTFPGASSTEVSGTYKVDGKSVYLDFSDETLSATIRATISGNLMKGVITLKGTNEKEDWIVERESSQNNSSSGKSTSGESRENRPSDLIEKLPPSPVLTGALLVVHDKELVLVDGKLRPAKGYRWVNPKDPKDFEVEPIP